MKNVTVFLDYIQTSTNILLQTSNECGTSFRQGRTYGPLLGLFLASLLSKALAKYAASSFLPLAHSVWTPHSHKPVNYISYNQIHQPSSHWKPAEPYLHGLTAFAASPHHEFSPVAPHSVSEITQTEHPMDPMTAISAPVQLMEDHILSDMDTTVESPDAYDQSASGSQLNYRRRKPPNRWYNNNLPTKRSNPNRVPNDYYWTRNPQVNRVRTTTPYYDYNYNYYDYEELTTRYIPPRTRRPTPQRRPPPVNSYNYSEEESDYDDSYYEDQYETTTKPYRRTRKTTKKVRTKKRPTIKKRKDSESYESSESVEDSSEEKAREVETKAKQRQQTTTTTTTESTEATTEETTTAVTTTTSSTTEAPKNTTDATGYGPGGGYDHISFTYGPPIVNQQYGPPYAERNYPEVFPLFHRSHPYSNWIPQEVTKNAILKKVHDLVGYNEDYVH